MSVVKHYLVPGKELRELMQGIFHFHPTKQSWDASFKPAPPVVKNGVIRGYEVELTGREVVRNGLDGHVRTCEMRSKVDGRSVSRRRLLELCGDVV